MAAIDLSTKAAGMELEQRAANGQTGFTMIEVLVALLIIVLGLLGLAGLQTRLQQAEFESYQRTQALVLLYDMVDRIQMHRVAANCFRFTTDAAAGTPYIGSGGAAPTGCASAGTAADNTAADQALAELDAQLEGAAEIKGGARVGAIVGARGCVSYDATTELPGAAGTGIYTASIAWQGTVDTVAPTVGCANNQYGAETRRRVVFTTFRIAKLD